MIGQFSALMLVIGHPASAGGLMLCVLNGLLRPDRFLKYWVVSIGCEPYETLDVQPRIIDELRSEWRRSITRGGLAQDWNPEHLYNYHSEVPLHSPVSTLRSNELSPNREKGKGHIMIQHPALPFRPSR